MSQLDGDQKAADGFSQRRGVVWGSVFWGYLFKESKEPMKELTGEFFGGTDVQ